uniref:Uncharacterized protein n=1 Tax=Takifugu rubripes TaxID=31033 RepID=A0A674PFV8_TAKRU
MLCCTSSLILFNTNLSFVGKKYLLALAVADICSGVTLTCFLLCQAHEKKVKRMTTLEKYGTWHAIGSSWRNSECMDCTCAGCCSAFSIPSSFDDDCISVFDKVACEYKVYKKDNPSISCPIYGAVGK